MQTDKKRRLAVWSSDWTKTTGQALVTRRVIENQPRIEWIDASYGDGGIRSALRVFGAVSRLYSALIKRCVRDVYLVCSRSGFGFLRDVPALAASLTGARVVVHVHGSDIVDLLSRSPLAWLARALYNRCDIVVPSKHLIEPLQALCRGNLLLCENFVPNAVLEDGIIGRETSGPLVVWNSNIMASKGIFDVAEAVGLARDARPDLSLVAIGRPFSDAEMTAEAAQKTLDGLCREDWFTHLGAVSAEKAFSITAEADIVVFPSRYRSECQPLAIVQAMCLGRRLILNDTPALRATVGDYPAIFLSNADNEHLASVILGVIGSEPQSDLEDAAAKARTRFSPELFDETIADILIRV